MALSDLIKARLQLSTLVSYLNHIDSLNEVNVLQGISRQLSILFSDATKDNIDWKTKDKFNETKEEIHKNIDIIPALINDLRQEVKAEVEKGEAAYYRQSKFIYENMKTDSIEYILERQPLIPDEVDEVLRSRLQIITDWKFPGIMFRPAKGAYTRTMVACDPFYVVDTDEELLAPFTDEFSDRYKRRLRRFAIDESSDELLVDRIPKNQVGCIFAINFFEYRTIDLIRRYLDEFWELMRPGASALITYNNCDLYKSVEMVEKKSRCYTPGKEIIKYVKDLGFELNAQFDFDDSLSWIEFSKPGTLTSRRAGQSLARIVAKH